MRNTDEETQYWRFWTRMPSLALMVLGLLLITGTGFSTPVCVNATNTTYMDSGSNYTVCTWTRDGAFNDTPAETVRLLVCAGGAGGGDFNSFSGEGGGGAGGLYYNSSYALSGALNVAIKVGVGGAPNRNGSNSTFGSIFTQGGGTGGNRNYTDDQKFGSIGGSGGGGLGASSSQAGGSATGYYKGNSGGSGGSDLGGGGGGANTTGEAGDSGGRGGSGLYYNISGSDLPYAAGGGGGSYTGGAAGTGGSGIGGNGGATSSNYATNGTNGTCSGGGGAGSVGGWGGSGVVIIRFLTTLTSGVITASLTSPANAYNFASGIGSVPISFNCSGDSNLDYLANLTVNGVVNGTSIPAYLNASSNWTINSSIDGTFVWSVLCYNSTTSTNSTARTFYISNSVPNISNLNISTAYQLGPVSANVTATDAESGSLTILYTWYKNGVNTSAGSVSVANGTMTTIDAALSPYVVGDKWDILVVASDATNTSAGNTSANTTILNYFSSVVFANETLYGGINSGAYLNFTLAGAASATAYFFIGTNNVSMTNSGVAPNYQFFANSIPPYVTTPTNYTAYWYFKAILANGSTYELYNSSSNTVNISGFYLCNTSLITNSINYSFLDATTFLPVNVYMTSVYTWTSDDLAIRVNSVSNTSPTSYVCISPPTFNKSTDALESMVASGFTSKVLSQPAQYYSNSSFNRVVYMVNSSYTANVVISVKNPAGAAYPSYTVLLYKYFSIFSTYNLTNSGLTDSTGQTVQSIELFPTVYQVVVLDDTGVIVKNITNPDVPFCSGLNYGQSCIYNIIIGSANPDYYGSIQSTFDGGGLCNFDNSTMYLTCNYNGSGSSSSFILKYLNVTLINGSYQQANIINSNQSIYNGTSLTLKIAAPNASGTYFYQFYGVYQGGSTNTTALTGYDVLDSGTITIRTTPQFDPGRDVAIILVMLVIVVALLLNQSPTIMILATGGVITFAAIIGLIVVSPLLIGVLVIMTVILADWVKGV